MRCYDSKPFTRAQEIEMATIIYQFVHDNAHLLSDGVLKAAELLLEEIKKLESLK